MIPEGKFGQHLPLNLQNETFALEEIDLDVLTLADWLGAFPATPVPLVTLIRARVMAAKRIHSDDTTVPVLISEKPSRAVYGFMGDERPSPRPTSPAAIFRYFGDCSVSGALTPFFNGSGRGAFFT